MRHVSQQGKKRQQSGVYVQGVLKEEVREAQTESQVRKASVATCRVLSIKGMMQWQVRE